MKKSMAFAALLLLLAGCAKEGPKFFQGRYGYTVSGKVTCEYVSDTLEDGTLVMDSRSFRLQDEKGVLHIEPHGDAMVVAMLPLSGQSTGFDAQVSGTEITLSPARRSIKIYDGDDVISENVDVELSGKGYKTNGLLMMDLYCKEGSFTVHSLGQDTEYKITGSDIHCIATAQ